MIVMINTAVKTKNTQFSSTCINRFLHKMVISTNLGFDLSSYIQVLNFQREKLLQFVAKSI